MASRRCAGRRLRWLFLLVLAGAGVAVAVSRRSAGAERSAPPNWPPMAPGIADLPQMSAPLAPVAEPAAAADPAASETPRWVAPTADGGCPHGYPIKANDNSGIFHLPGGRFYDRTAPERCYATAADAAADGYRQAKA